MSDDDFKELELKLIASTDVAALKKAHVNYGQSWKKRGGVGAFMMLARKWDRIENMLRPQDSTLGRFAPWDIFGALQVDKRPEGLIDDIRDLRRYLLLVESEFVGRHPELQKDAKDEADAGASYTAQ